MPLRTDSYYRELASRCLREAGVDEPPVSLEAVAGHLGVPLTSVRFPSWFSGALLVEDGMPVVLLNSVASEEGRRAALGHMLGHIVVRVDDPAASYPREDTDGHRFADVMAEEFVLPSYLVQDQARKWFNDYRYLSGLFGVSETDMLEKMRQMGLIKTRGTVWDY